MREQKEEKIRNNREINMKKENKLIRKYNYLINYIKNNIEYFIKYLKFYNKYKIKFNNFMEHQEILDDSNMYDYFIPNKNDIVLDIGSQYGDYALLWEKRNKSIVYSFEALESNFNKMVKDFKINNSKIYAYSFFIGNGEEISYNIKWNMAINTKSENKMKTIKMDDFIFNNNIIPNIIKIDVEGFEKNVLQGLVKTLNKYNPKIIIETHSKQLRKECNDFLNENNYFQVFEGRKVILNNVFDEVVNLFYEKTNNLAGANSLAGAK